MLYDINFRCAVYRRIKLFFWKERFMHKFINCSGFSPAVFGVDNRGIKALELPHNFVLLLLIGKLQTFVCGAQ
jgi:hypothetical protein